MCRYAGIRMDNVSNIYCIFLVIVISTLNKLIVMILYLYNSNQINAGWCHDLITKTKILFLVTLQTPDW